MVCKRLRLLQLLLLLGAMRLSALEIAFRVTPEIAIPSGGDSTSLYKVGFAGTVNADTQFLNCLSVGPEFSYFYVPLNGTGTSIQFANAGVSVGAYAYPMSRLRVQLESSGGVYQAMSDSASCGNLWWKIHANAGFRLTPSFNLAATGGYITFLYPGSPLYSAIVAGVSGQLSIDTRVATGNVAVFPRSGRAGVSALLRHIQTEQHRNAYARERRNGRNPRRDGELPRGGLHVVAPSVRLRFLSCRNGSRRNCRSMRIFPRPFKTSPKTERCPAKSSCRTKLLGDSRTVSKTVVVQVYNRNTVRWTDKAVLASYISPNAPEVLDIGKYIIGIARSKLRTGLNRNMQFAMYVLEGLKVGGMVELEGLDDAVCRLPYRSGEARLHPVSVPDARLSFRRSRRSRHPRIGDFRVGRNPLGRHPAQGRFRRRVLARHRACRRQGSFRDAGQSPDDQ